MSTIRIALLVGQTIIGAALTEIFNREENICLVGTGADFESALAVTMDKEPDVVVVEVAEEEETALRLIAAVAEVVPHARVVVLTDRQDRPLQQQLILKGALGIVSKAAPIETLLQAVRRVHEGGVWLDSGMLNRVLTQLQRERSVVAVNEADTARIAAITPRESEVLQLIGEGLSDKLIANRLGLSERTVHRHLSSLFFKLDVSDRLGLLLFGQRTGLLLGHSAGLNG